jgi:hypothetical protein
MTQRELGWDFTERGDDVWTKKTVHTGVQYARLFATFENADYYLIYKQHHQYESTLGTESFSRWYPC